MNLTFITFCPSPSCQAVLPPGTVSCPTCGLTTSSATLRDARRQVRRFDSFTDQQLISAGGLDIDLQQTEAYSVKAQAVVDAAAALKAAQQELEAEVQHLTKLKMDELNQERAERQRKIEEAKKAAEEQEKRKTAQLFSFGKRKLD
jgi:hypothetical protein